MECEILNIKKALTVTPSLLTGVPLLVPRLPHWHLPQPSPPAPPAQLAQVRAPVHFEFSHQVSAGQGCQGRYNLRSEAGLEMFGRQQQEKCRAYINAF
jgi:hypothetical protein